MRDEWSSSAPWPSCRCVCSFLEPPSISPAVGNGGADSRPADHSLTSLRRTSLELQPAEVPIRPIRKLWSVPKACPNAVAQAVF